MATTLSYGFVKPVDGDKGQSFFDAQEANIQQVNDHSHNGTNSAKLTTSAVVVVTQSIASGSWTLDANGHYKQTVTMPGTLLTSECLITMRNAAGDQVFPTIQRTSTTQYVVWTIDNTVGYTAVYT